MPVSTLVVTPGAADANAYVSLAVADQYHLDRPAPAAPLWSDATEAEKTAAILWATQLLDSLYEWEGEAPSEDQALCWPRSGLLTRNGYDLDDETIPVEIQRATAEFARQLLSSDRAADSDIETQGIRSMKAGPVELAFADTVTAKVLPDAVFNLIPLEWGEPRGRAMATRKLVRA